MYMHICMTDKMVLMVLPPITVIVIACTVVFVALSVPTFCPLFLSGKLKCTMCTMLTRWKCASVRITLLERHFGYVAMIMLPDGHIREGGDTVILYLQRDVLMLFSAVTNTTTVVPL